MASCRELEVVREALSRILQEHNPLPPHQRLARDAELSARIHGGGHEHRHGAEGGLEIEDKRLVSRLLQQVNHLASEEGNEEVKALVDHRGHDGRRRWDTGTSEVDAVEIMRFADAEVVKATMTSTVEIIETQVVEGWSKQSSTGSDSLDSKASMNKDIGKRLEKQNKLTHWILGAMLLGTAIWRLKLASMALGVQRTLDHPLRALGSLISKKLFKGTRKEEPRGANPFQNADSLLPPILGGGGGMNHPDQSLVQNE